MKVKVEVQAATLVLDNKNMTWTITHDGIMSPLNKMVAFPEIVIGEHMYIPLPDGETFKTTRVRDFETLEA